MCAVGSLCLVWSDYMFVCFDTSMCDSDALLTDKSETYVATIITK